MGIQNLEQFWAIVTKIAPFTDTEERQQGTARIVIETIEMDYK